MPQKEHWEAYSNRTVRPSVRPSRFRVQSISPIFFEVGIPNLMCGYILGWRSVAYHFRVTVTLTSDLVSSPESKAPRWAISIPVTPSSVVCPSVRQHFQTSSPLKPLGQLNSNFIWRLLRMGERQFVQMFLVTWPRWPPCPYMVKTL